MKVLIVEDQAGARRDLVELCECREDVNIVGEAASGRTAIDAAGALNPDIVLLDAELPDMSGFDLLRAVATDTCPLGIVVSKCADHATRAFEEGVFDYLVMPVQTRRFERALSRARQRLDFAAFKGGPSAPYRPEPARAPAMTPRFLVGERQRRLYPLDPKSIDYIESDGNYVTLRVGNVEYLSRDSIKRLALTLTSNVCLHSSAAYRDSILRIIPLPAFSKRYGSVAP